MRQNKWVSICEHSLAPPVPPGQYPQHYGGVGDSGASTSSTGNNTNVRALLQLIPAIEQLSLLVARATIPSANPPCRLAPKHKKWKTWQFLSCLQGLVMKVSTGSMPCQQFAAATGSPAKLKVVAQETCFALNSKQVEQQSPSRRVNLMIFVGQ